MHDGEQDPFQDLGGAKTPIEDLAGELERGESMLDRWLEARLGILPRWRSLMLLLTFALAATCHVPWLRTWLDRATPATSASAAAGVVAGPPACGCSGTELGDPAETAPILQLGPDGEVVEL